MKTVFVTLTARGAELAGHLSPNLPESEVHALRGRVDGVDLLFDDTLPHIADLYRQGHAVIGICAAGILIRALGTLLADKTAEPPVIAMAENGSSVVPLLGGHGGANRLARDLADMTKGHAALTTAGDVAFGLALDEPPEGWRISNRAKAREVVADALAGNKVGLTVDAGDAGWLTRSAFPFAERDDGDVRVTHRIADGRYTLHPPVLALGVGCERNSDAAELIALCEQVLSDNGLSADAVACVASIDVKMDEPAVHALAAHLNAPARFFAADRLEAEAVRLKNPSGIVFAEVGCHGVAEGAALACVGDRGELICEKTKSTRATLAVGLSPADIDVAGCGRRRGKLNVVGIGPGKSGWRTPAVSRAISGSSDVVGYTLYLDLLEGLIDGKNRHMSELAQEEDRVRKALDLAAEGREVALVCSGDAGIYALATLVFEVVDFEQRDDWNQLEIVVEPGVSAIQAAASRIGAPIGHDFCTISLSDLLTPWTEIEKRLRAAAAGDFVVAFYNPVSKRRRRQLETARDILLTERSRETPVMLARNLGRPEERVTYISLGELTADHADMLTLVMVGNSQSRVMMQGGQTRAYTPRGYARKFEDNKAKQA